MADDESSYKIMIDANEFNKQRKNRTKNLLSGGFGRPAEAVAPMSFVSNVPTDTQQPGNLQQKLFVDTYANRPNNTVTSNLQQNLFVPKPIQQTQSIFGGGFPQDSSNLFRPVDGSFAARRFQEQSTQGLRGDQGNHGNIFSQHTEGWNRANSSKSSRSPSRKRKHKKNKEKTNFWDSDNGSSTSGGSAHSRSRRSRRRGNSQYNNRYNISESDDSTSGSDDNDRRVSDRAKKIALDTIREYCPDSMHNVVYEDIVAQMEQLDKKGYKLPKGYDKRKHDVNENEIRLYEQQVQRDKHRDQRKMSYLINFSAQGLTWFCESMNFDWIKTRNLPRLIRDGLEEGEFDDCLEGIGMYLRGTVFDNPIFSTVLKFVEKIGEAHNEGVEAETERLEKEEERREVRNQTALRSLNKFRATSSDEANDEPFSLDVPAPRSKKPLTSSLQKASSFDKKNAFETKPVTKDVKTPIVSDKKVLKKVSKDVKAPIVSDKKVSKDVKAPIVSDKKVSKEPTVDLEEKKLNSTDFVKKGDLKHETCSETKHTYPTKPKKRGFKKIPDIVIPKGMSMLASKISEPMKQFEQMIDDQDNEDEKESEEVGQRFSMNIY
jgi:hypothetical protein